MDDFDFEARERPELVLVDKDKLYWISRLNPNQIPLYMRSLAEARLLNDTTLEQMLETFLMISTSTGGARTEDLIRAMGARSQSMMDLDGLVDSPPSEGRVKRGLRKMAGRGLKDDSP